MRLATMGAAAWLLAGQAATPLHRAIAPHAVGEPVVHAGAPCMSAVEIAWAARIPIGCEEPTDSFDRVGMATSSIAGITVREALERLVETNPSFVWRESGSTVVVRPAAAWAAADHFLHQTVESGTLDAPEVLTRGLERIGRLWFGRVPQVAVDQWLDRRFLTLEFTGGTVLDLLNALAHAEGHLVWRVVHAPEGPGIAERIAFEFITPSGEGARWEWGPRSIDRD